jgi:SAM-dependent methyltransferase
MLCPFQKVPPKKMPALKRTAVWLYRMGSPILDPILASRGFAGYLRFVHDWRQYSRMSGAERLHLIDAHPCLHERTSTTGIDAHYFYLNGWAMRRILAQRPVRHVDIGSSTMFVNLLGAVVAVDFVDFRPLSARIAGLTSTAGDILNLPFADGSIASLSCLHVAEHVGLGRYGDDLNPDGTRLACQQLRRVLEPGGFLYLGIPVGRHRVCFNAHRVHPAQLIVEYCAGLELLEFSGVGDDGQFLENVKLDTFNDCEYACGFFRFGRPG